MTRRVEYTVVGKAGVGADIHGRNGSSLVNVTGVVTWVKAGRVCQKHVLGGSGGKAAWCRRDRHVRMTMQYIMQVQPGAIASSTSGCASARTITTKRRMSDAPFFHTPRPFGNDFIVSRTPPCPDTHPPEMGAETVQFLHGRSV